MTGRRSNPAMRMKDHPLWLSWWTMRQRCTNPNVQAFPYYGGRGIKVCERWTSDFWAFVADMGERPPDTSLDRINNNGNYEPSNCRWATKAEQSANRKLDKRIRWVTHDGKTLPAARWAKLVGIAVGTVNSRLALGWSADEALNTPPGKHRRKNYDSMAAA